MASVRIKGGPELMGRLANIVASADEMERAWAQDASKRIRSDAPRRTGKGAASITEGTSKGRGAVYGNYYLGILDRGTKAYTIQPRKSGGTLRFEYKGRTVFAKKSERKRLRRRPFITKNAQDALRGLPVRDAILRAWSRKSAKGRRSRLAL